MRRLAVGIVVVGTVALTLSIARIALADDLTVDVEIATILSASISTLAFGVALGHTASVPGTAPASRRSMWSIVGGLVGRILRRWWVWPALAGVVASALWVRSYYAIKQEEQTALPGECSPNVTSTFDQSDEDQLVPNYTGITAGSKNVVTPDAVLSIGADAVDVRFCFRVRHLLVLRKNGVVDVPATPVASMQKNDLILLKVGGMRVIAGAVSGSATNEHVSYPDLSDDSSNTRYLEVGPAFVLSIPARNWDGPFTLRLYNEDFGRTPSVNRDLEIVEADFHEAEFYLS